MTNTPTIPAGWYPDPAGSGNSRWWDGARWTDTVQTPYSLAAHDARSSEGAPVYSVWIWLAVVLPYASLPFLFMIDFSSILDVNTLGDGSSTLRSQFAFFTSPGVILSTLIGWLALAAAIVAGYRDWRWLQTVGVARPFHWAWIFALLGGYPVYAIGRAVVTRRRTGRGSAVLWVTIALFALSFLVSIVWAIMITASMMQQVDPYVT